MISSLDPRYGARLYLERRTSVEGRCFDWDNFPWHIDQ
jgi:hypothetical protein